ncbi:MAG: WG repeat-containing protein [Bacteroidales bacterium]|nr:WG repeat-containing protein [Bacteroidales bacterium]
MTHLRTLLVALAALLCPLAAAAQTVEYVDDEACGCELVFIDGIQTTTDGTLYGFRRADGTTIAPNRYAYVDHFHGDYCKVYLDRSHCGMIDREGNEIVPCLYSDLDYPAEGRILAISEGRMGHLNMRGEVVIPLQYRQAGNFSEGLAPVLIDLDSFSIACTFIDTNGQQVFPPIYQNVMPFCEGYAPVRRYDRWGLIDHTGREVLPTRYEEMTTPQNGHFFTGDSAHWALFDYSMQPLTPFVYDWTAAEADRRIPVRRNGKYGFLDPSGHEVIPCIYDLTGIFRLGRTMVKLADHYGIIDTTGRIILPIDYDDRTPTGMKYMYYDSLALVEKDGKLGFVDLEGHLSIPFYFEGAYHFSEGLACVKHKGAWGYIDTHGEVYIPFAFQYASPYEWGRAEVVYDGNVSHIDRRGKCVKNCKGIIAWRDYTE